MNATTGFFMCRRTNSAAASSAVPPISPIITTALGGGIGLEEREHVDEGAADDRVAADPDAGRLPDAETRELVDRLVGERAGARHHAHRARARDVGGHDADPALPRA